jgi:hypothetical protein
MKNWIVTPEDLKRGDLLPTGWHPVEVIKVEESEASEEAKNPGSTNITFWFRVIDGEAKSAEVKRLFNETAWGFAKDFFATMKFPKDAKGNYQISMQLFEQTIGHKLMVYIKRGKSNRGNEYNDVADFKPMAA